jgi:hypothetical protein
VVVADNEVRGPWQNGVVAVNLIDSEIRGNRVDSPAHFGLAVNLPNSPSIATATGNQVRNNRLSGAGSAGIFVAAACDNLFVGNVLGRNAGNVGALFDVSTGANVLLGNGTIVMDNGDHDCTGDGVADPNQITGLSRDGAALGAAIRNAMAGAQGPAGVL